MSDSADTPGRTSPSHRVTAPQASAGARDTLPPPVRRLLAEHLNGLDAASRIHTRPIKKGVHRLTIQNGQNVRSVIVKRLAPDVAYRNQMLATRWLPAVGLEASGPILLGTVAEPGGRRVWHMYEDMGETSLDSVPVSPALLEDSVRLIATLHRRFADHVLLGECRLWGGNLGMAYYHCNAVDAVRGLEAIDVDQLRPEHRAAVFSLLDALRLMLEDEQRRAGIHMEHGGPETMLHGDLWRQNILLCSTGDDEVRPRLIDWDHVGVGQVGYDLSTLLLRFPRGERNGVMEIYRQELSKSGWRLPSATILNLLFDTAERARIANRVIWPSIEIARGGHVAWATDHLIELVQWFDQIEAVLP